MNGVSAIRGFKFQRDCIVYLLLKTYLDDSEDFEHLICENGIFDFELWSRLKISKYQVKNTNKINAEYLNILLRDYIKNTNSIKRKYILYFVLSSQPKGSFNHLLLKLKGDRSVKKFNKRTEDFIHIALESINLKKVCLSYLVYSEEDLKNMLIGISKSVLWEYYPKDLCIPPILIDNLVYKLRDKIDELSTKQKSEDRIIRKEKLDYEIKYIVKNTGYIDITGKEVTPKFSITDKKELERNKSIKDLPHLEEPSSLPGE